MSGEQEIRSSDACDKKAQDFTIEKVKNDQDKYLSYKAYFDRYNKAFASEFYLECLWILYAMIEDRTCSFLYHIGFTRENERSKVTPSRRIKKDIRAIYNLESQKPTNYKFNNLGGKLVRIKELLTWCKGEHETLSDYQKVLVRVMLPFAESRELLEALNYLAPEWINKRNQLIHALFTKNSAAATEELRPLVEDGYHAIRRVDEAVKKIKRHSIRLKFKIK